MSRKFDLAEYKRLTAAKQIIVDVVPPSGMTFKFRKPNKSILLFGIGDFSPSAFSEAITKWKKISQTGEIDSNELTETDKAILDKTQRAIRMVFELSVKPKLVIGLAKNENELSTDDINDDDLDYFLKWILSGGTLSANQFKAN